ncbi:MAG: hypothetical protein R3E89_16825 [Thiolinea sp.]
MQYDDAALPDDDVVVLLGGDNAMLSDLLERAAAVQADRDGLYPQQRQLYLWPA